MTTQVNIEKTYSVDEFMDLVAGRNDARFELVKGKLIEMSLAGDQHGRISAKLLILLGYYVLQNDLGQTYGSDTGFVLDETDPKKPTVRGPDVAFTTKERLSKVTTKAVPIPPDLAVEVMSPNDYSPETLEKVREYQQAGVRLIWIIRPKTQTVEVYRQYDKQPTTLTIEDELDGEQIIKGFMLKVKVLFS